MPDSGNDAGAVSSLSVVFETHSSSEDNERDIASGWHDPSLSDVGRGLAARLGERRAHDGIVAVYSSDLRRAVQTARIAFKGSDVPLYTDRRLRECDYGADNGQPASRMHAKRGDHLDVPYPDGESWRQAVARVGEFLVEAARHHAGERILLIGHVATRWALDHFLDGIPLEALIGEGFAWKEGWEYVLPGYFQV